LTFSVIDPPRKIPNRVVVSHFSTAEFLASDRSLFVLNIEMVFKAYKGLKVDYIPDDIIVPELIFNHKYGRRPLSQSNKALLIDAPSGTKFNIETVAERTESLAKGLQKELGVEVGWNGVIGLFAPNHVQFPERH
jgi:hypothetical protein